MKERSVPAIALQPGYDKWEVVRGDDKVEFVDDFASTPTVSRNLRALDSWNVKQVFLNRYPNVVRLVEKHRFCWR